MATIPLSICILTYNRVERVTNCVKRIVSECKSDEIEILVGDNASSDGTEEAIAKIKDARLRYYKNKSNLGIAGNLLKIVKEAKGDFIYIHWDDDLMELSVIPWLLETIKKNPSLNQILGRIEESSGRTYWSCKNICENCGDKLIKPSFKSWKMLFFSYSHGGARILRKASINLNYAKNFLESIISPYMHQVLAIHPVLTGDTLCTSKTLYYYKGSLSESAGHFIKGKPYWDASAKVNQLKDKLKIYNDIINEVALRNTALKNFTEAQLSDFRKTLFDKQRKHTAESLINLLFSSFSSFLEALPRVLKSRDISRSYTFWKHLLKKFFMAIGYRILVKIKSVNILKTALREPEKNLPAK